jgi:hypothetical protein
MFRKFTHPACRVAIHFGALALCFAAPVMSQDRPAPPRLEFAFEVRVQVADPVVVARLPSGQTRRIIDILGGTAEGPGIKGEVLSGGADWQLIRHTDGFTDIDARYTIRTDEGHLIYVSNIGIRHASPEVMRRLNAGEVVDQSEIYFRAIPKFETEAPGLEWLMKHVFVSTGERYPNGVVIRFWKVL